MLPPGRSDWAPLRGDCQHYAPVLRLASQSRNRDCEAQATPKTASPPRFPFQPTFPMIWLPTSLPWLREHKIFPLPIEKGARMLRRDLALAGIPYRDASGLVFDFHALRCQCATLADAAGVSPRRGPEVNETFEPGTHRPYTRPRADDLEAAAESLPSLRPYRDQNDVTTLGVTGTGNDNSTSQLPPFFPTVGDGSCSLESSSDMITDSDDPTVMEDLSQKRRSVTHHAELGRARSVRGAAEIRTRDGGFADLCLTTWLRRHGRRCDDLAFSMPGPEENYPNLP